MGALFAFCPYNLHRSAGRQSCDAAPFHRPANKFPRRNKLPQVTKQVRVRRERSPWAGQGCAWGLALAGLGVLVVVPQLGLGRLLH